MHWHLRRRGCRPRRRRGRRPGRRSSTAAALACLESRCGLDAKTVDEAYKDFDKKEPWDEVLS
jgi:hypothetical protein